VDLIFQLQCPIGKLIFSKKWQPFQVAIFFGKDFLPKKKRPALRGVSSSFGIRSD
jgi:hypothetical protein